MVLSDQRNVMYVWAAFEAKSPPTRQDLVTLINNYTLYSRVLSQFHVTYQSKKKKFPYCPELPIWPKIENPCRKLG
jgi:hypothetical protein